MLNNKTQTLDFIKNNINELYELYSCSTKNPKTLKEFDKWISSIVHDTKASTIKPITIFDNNKLSAFAICCFDSNISFSSNIILAYFLCIYFYDQTNIVLALKEKLYSFMNSVNVKKIIGPIHDSIIYERGISLMNDSIFFTGIPKQELYISELMINNSFNKEQDLFELVFHNNNEDFVNRKIYLKLQKKFSELNFNLVDNQVIKNKCDEIVNFYNTEWNENWGFQRLDTTHAEKFFNSMPNEKNNAILAYENNNLVGFCMMLEENESNNETKKVRAYFIGVTRKYRKSGLAFYLLSEGINYLNTKKINLISCSWMLESNKNVLDLMTKFLPDDSITVRKHRIFQLTI